MRCAECGRSVTGDTYPSPLGERVCASCHDTIAGASMGMMTGGFGTGSAVGGAFLGAGLVSWFRKLFGREDRATTDVTGVENQRRDEAEDRRSEPVKKPDPDASGGSSW